MRLKFKRKSTGVIILIIEGNITRNSLCNYLYLKQAKMSCFSFYHFSFLFYKIGEVEGRINPLRG
jgi:hypothetical protein